MFKGLNIDKLSGPHAVVLLRVVAPLDDADRQAMAATGAQAGARPPDGG